MPSTCKVDYVKCVLPLDPLLVSISTKTYLENYLYLWEDQAISYLQTFYSEETFLRELNDPTLNYYLIYVQEIPAGFFKIKVVEASHKTGTSLMIDKLYLLKQFTGKQVGKQVLAHIEELALLQGFKLLSLQVMDSSPAKLFYLKNGYQQTGETRLTYPFIKKAYNLLLTLEKELG
jgi:GNAT superfamily N-acetyltransferase